MGITSIEWTDFSINPIRARLGEGDGHYCEKISPGCRNCYSSRLQPRFRMPMFAEQRGQAEPYLDAKKLVQVLKRRKPTKFFWCDMTDMFGAWVPNEWIDLIWATMLLSPQHTHQVLTKRPQRMLEYLRDPYLYPRVLRAADSLRAQCPKLTSVGISDPARFPAKWIWLGVSAEDQLRANERVNVLRRCPAAVHFLSMEPLLGPVALDDRWLEWLPLGPDADGEAHLLPPIRWVIVGSESGNGARPMEPAWARSIVDQCIAAGVSVFTKQIANEHDRKGGNPAHWPAGKWPREYPR